MFEDSAGEFWEAQFVCMTAGPNECSAPGSCVSIFGTVLGLLGFLLGSISWTSFSCRSTRSLQTYQSSCFSYMYLRGGVPSRKRLTTGGTREWLLLSMRPLVALDMFQSMESVRAVSAMESLGPSPAAIPRLASSS
jgi:hypothetical protein